MRKKLFLGIILAAGGIVGILAFRFYRQPLGPSLSFVGPTATMNLGGSDIEGHLDISGSTATPTPMCGGPAVMQILAIGSDARGNHYLYGLADVIRLVRVDFVRGQVAVLEVPRDLWVKIPDIADHYGIAEGKLNQAYLYGNKGLGYFDDPSEGPGLLARTLDLNFGAQPDHYLAVNMATFRNIVDAVGGIDVYLPYPVSARTPEYPNAFGVPAGQHHFDGETALNVARIRQYTVFGRAENQNIILCALRKKILSPAIVPAVPELISTFQRYVQTDLSPEQVNQLACLATQMHGEDVVFASFPIDLFKSARQYDPQLKDTTSVLEADRSVLRDYIRRFQEGSWPDPDLAVHSTPRPDQPDAEFACED